MSKFDSYEHLKIVLNPDGTLTRFANPPTVPATGDLQCSLSEPVVSKDVVLDPDKKTWLRIYRPTKLPSNDKSVVRLPIIIYIHGGGWISFSPDSIIVHENCNQFSGEVPAIVVSVGYRLAPESRLPAQYEDAVDAILWVKKQALDPNGDQWLKNYGDFSRCYLYGASNGGNIVFHAALRTIDLELSPLRFVGLIMNQPMFGAKQRTNSELKLATDEYLPLPVLDLMWELALPPGIDRDHRFSNPFVDGPYREKIKSLGKCLVIGFNGDPMFDRQQDFVQMLILQGVLVEAHFDVIGFHGVDLIDSRRAVVSPKLTNKKNRQCSRGKRKSQKSSHICCPILLRLLPHLQRSINLRPYSNDGKSLSSMLSYILPSVSLDGFRSNKHQHDIKPIQSLPVRWSNRGSSWKDNPSDSYKECDFKFENKETPNFYEENIENGSGERTECKNKGVLNAHEEYGDPGSGRSTSGSDMFEDATDPNSMEKLMPYLTEDSSFISLDLYEFLQSSLPNIVKGCQWLLLYSTIKHGISLRTLIRKAGEISGPCLLIAGDMQGAVFGGLLECPLRPTSKRKYQGTNQTFVFTTIYGEPRIFRPTGANRYFYMCLNDLLALGGGGNFALCLDGDLLTGTSGPCDTFGNLCLAHSQEFELKNVELWGFTHSSQYLT